MRAAVLAALAACGACATEVVLAPDAPAEQRWTCREAAACDGRVTLDEQVADGATGRDRARDEMLAVCRAVQGQIGGGLSTHKFCYSDDALPAPWSCDVLCVPAKDEQP